MRNNRVFINKDGLIEINVVGDQTVESTSAMGDEIQRLAHQLHTEKKQVLVLDVLFEMGNVPPEARQNVVNIAKAVDFDRAAMVGSGAILRLGANLILRAVGKASTVRYFDNLADATEWLKSTPKH